MLSMSCSMTVMDDTIPNYEQLKKARGVDFGKYIKKGLRL